MTRKDAFVSVVCPVQNADSILEPAIRTLSAVLSDHFQYYEVIVVDNASADGTASRIASLLRDYKNIQYCALSTRVNDTVAFAAGLDRAIGDFIVTIDLTVDPPETVPAMVAIAVSGTEIVYGLPRDRVRGATIYDRVARMFLTSFARFTKVNVPAAMSTARVFSRSVLNYILESRDYHRTLVLAPALSGYSFGSFEYDRVPSPLGDGRRVGTKALVRALDLIFSTSVRPLRLVTIFAVAMSGVSIGYAIYVVLTRLIMRNVAPGWATLSLQVSGMFFFLSVVLAVMCEYLLQILETTNQRPAYHVSREAYSSIMDYEQDLNVRDVDGRSARSVRPAKPMPLSAGPSSSNRPQGSK